MPEPEISASTSDRQTSPKHIVSRIYFFPTLNSSPEIFFFIFLHSEHLFWTDGFDCILVLFFYCQILFKKATKKSKAWNINCDVFHTGKLSPLNFCFSQVRNQPMVNPKFLSSDTSTPSPSTFCLDTTRSRSKLLI